MDSGKLKVYPTNNQYNKLYEFCLKVTDSTGLTYLVDNLKL